jgi:transposase-like protein
MRGNYTEEQKAEVMEMLQAKVKASEIEEITGVKVGTIYRWRSEAKKVFEENDASKIEDEGSSK